MTNTLNRIRLVFLLMCVSFGISACRPADPNTNAQSGTGNQTDNREQGRSRELLVDVQAQAADGVSPTPTPNVRVIRSRTVVVNSEVLSGLPTGGAGITNFRTQESETTISIKLFDDAKYVGVIDQYESPSPDSKAWSGHLKDADGTFTIVVDGNGIFGTVRVADKGVFRIQTVGNSTVVRELDTKKFKDPEGPSSDRVEPRLAPSPTTPQATATPTPEDGSVTDILVLYTPAARDAAAADAGHEAGTTADIERLIASCISETNAAYVRSGIVTRLNLVSRGVVTYDKDKEGNSALRTILGHLTNKGDGQLDEAHSLRDNNRADVVALLVVDNDEGGRANGMDNTNNNEKFESEAFAIAAWDDAIDNLSFSHEVGHVQGCDHDRDSTDTRGVYDYSFGYRFTCKGKQYHTIMAYRPGILIPYFSNPDVKYPDASGCATGVPEGEANPCNEAKTINNTRTIVANFRRKGP